MSSWEEYKKKKQKNKNISTNTNSTNQVVTPTTNTANWNNVINRANQMLANTRNVNNLVSMQNPLIMKSQDNLISDEQAKYIANIDDSKKRFEAVSRISKNKKQLVQNNLQVNKIRENEKSKKEAEKINKDISQGNYMSSVGHVLKGLPTEALNAVTKTTLSLANLNPNTKDSKEMMEAGKLLTSRYNDTTSQINNKIVQGASRVSGTIGNMLPSIATSMMGGPAGLVNAINVGSSSYMETLNEEQDNKLKSTLTALGKGTLSYYIEKLSGGNFLGKGSLDDIAKQGISKIKSDIGKRITSKLYEVGGEIAEENLENITGYVVDKLINDKDITMEQFISDLKQTSGDTAITTLVLSALGLGGDTYNQSKINEVIDNSSLSNEQKSALKNVVEKDNASLEEVQELIGKTSKNQTTTMQNNEILNNNKQVIQQTQQTAQNQTSQETLGNGKYSIKMPNSNYKFTKSGNEKVDNLRQDANKYWNNSKDTQKLMTTLEKVMNDKDVSIRIDDSITDEQGNILDGKYQNGVITINPNSTKAIEYVATHELTHAIGTKEMLDMVQKYRESNSEFNSKVETLLKNYNKSELTEEALADVSAQLFGTQEFIANVQNTNPNLFQRICNEIKYLWHQFRGYKNEGQFIDDLYNKWTKAYNSNSELNQTTKYMNVGLKGFTNAEKNIDKILDKETLHKYESLQKTVKKAVKMAIDGKSAKEILRATNGKWTKNNVNNQVIFNISDKDISFRKRLSKNSSYKLGDVIQHDELFFCYPNLLDLKVVTKDLNKSVFAKFYAGKRLEDSRIEIQNTDITNTDKLLESLVHEIQHAVQKIEGTITSKGYSANDIKYLNNILEIEADDQAYRYRNNIKNNFPEVSKKHPKHNYMEDKKMLEKIPIEAYNLFIGYKGVVNQNENNKRFLQNDNRVNRSSVSNTAGKNNGRGRNGVFYRYNSEEQTKRTYEEKEINSKTSQELEKSSSFNLPENNQETRYSKENAEWEKYLKENFKSEGTKTYKEQVKLPEANVLQENTSNIDASKLTAEDFKKYKRKIIEGKQKEINNLIQIKNQILTEIQKKIDTKQEQLKNFKKTNSITAQKLKAQIETLKERYNRIENEYIQRIDRRNQRVNRALIEAETKRELKRTRKQVQKALLQQAEIEEINIDDAKNISTLNMNRTDPIRLQEKVFGKELGNRINEMFFYKVKHNTAEKTRFLNRERDSIKRWDIKPRSKESEILQKYTEKSFVNEEGKEIEYTEQDLINDISHEKTRNKIIEASKELREKYDNYIDTANDILVDLGYSPIPKRKDYVRHFTELNDIFSKYGIPGKFNESLPTDINGLTEGFRPGKNFFANAQRRLGNKTTYDAITGIDGYLEGISNLIYHTEDIQRLRAFDKFIRDTYGENGLENFDKLSDKEKNKRIELIQNNHLSEYAKWLTEYTNNLAGKNSVFDRSVEGFLGRKVYSALNAIKKQTGSNMTGFNLGSALTNFVSVVQGASKTKKIALLKGISSSLQNIVVKDDFVDNSDFLTSRFGSDSISKKAWDKASNVGQVFMSATDYLSSNIVVRSKYYEQVAKGKTEEEAMKIANDFGARILGDRSQGAVANVFNSKMLGIVTQFQLEVNNQFDTFIHDTKLDYKETDKKEGALKASMGAVWTLGQLAVYQHIFNEVFEKINGNRPAFDVIEIIKTALGVDDEEEEKDVKGNLQEAVVMLIESLPFLNLFSENARVPIASAIPNPISIATGESTLKKEASKLIYLVPPTGGGQIKKTAEGIKTVSEGGSYFINSKDEKELRFPVENASAKDYIKAGLFGKYGLPLAKDYVDKDYKRLSSKATDLYDNSTIEFRKLNEYLEYSKPKEIKKNDKISYINNMNITTEEKWDLYKYDIISDTERDNGTSQVTDAEYAIKNKLATKDEYMKLYADAQKNEVEFPDEEKMKELKENDYDLKTYMKYKTEAKIKGQEKKDKFEKQQKSMLPISEEEQIKSKSLNDTDKINIIKQNKYTEEEKDRIYVNEIGKEDDVYTSLKLINKGNNRIDEYLDYKTADLSSDKKDDGTKNGKTIRGSAEDKFVKYMKTSKFSNVERLYLYGTKYKLNNTERRDLQNYIKGLGLTKTEQEEIYKSLSSTNVVEMKDGSIKWKN